MNLRAVINYVLIATVTIILLWLVFRSQDLNAIYQNLLQANYYWVLLSVLVSFVAHYLRALRWKMLIKPLGHVQPSNGNAFHAVMIGYLANLAIPRMGEITRCGVLNRTNKIPLNQLIGTVIVERITDVVSLLIIFIAAIIIAYDQLFQFVYENLLQPVTLKIEKAAALWQFALGLGIIVIIGLWLIRRNWDKLKELNSFKKIQNIIVGLKEGIWSIGKMEQKGLFLVYSAGIWFLYILSTYCCYFAITATSQLSFNSSIFIMAMGGIGMSVPVQGGIGAYEASVQVGLLVYGIAAVDGLSYATLNHFAQIASIVLAGTISMLIIFINFGKAKNAKRATE